MSEVAIRLPQKLIPVFDGDADVRGSYGGRGSAKTRSFATMVAVKGYIFGKAGITGQLLCARQYQNSLEESSLEECKRAIADEPWLSDYYDVGDKFIRSHDRRISFSFAGLARNINNIKSKGRILLCWVDEAEDVTNEAWTILIPTLREEGDDWNAELWVTWNPKHKGSPTDKRFKNSSDSRYKIAQLNWRDNPMFPAVLERQRQRDSIERPDEYDHIWEGAYGYSQGSILAKLVSKLDREGKLNDSVMFDKDGAPIEVSSDIGFRDTASWWYWQRKVGGFSLLKYEGASGFEAQDWIKVIAKSVDDLGGNLGQIHLPHDARAKTFASKHSAHEQFADAFGWDKVSIVPISSKSDRINAARTVLQRCEFNRKLCEDGIDGLSAWEYEFNPDTQAFSREPLHNWASHPSDAFSYGAQVMIECAQEKEKEPDPKFMLRIGEQQTMPTFNQLLEQQKRKMAEAA